MQFIRITLNKYRFTLVAGMFGLLFLLGFSFTLQASASLPSQPVSAADPGDFSLYFWEPIPDMIDYAYDFYVANFDADPMQEILIRYDDGDSYVVYDLNTQAVLYSRSFPVTMSWPQVDVVDLNDDGIAEIVLSTAGVQIAAINTATGSVMWSSLETYSTQYSNDIVIVDIDLDGWNDVVQTSGNGYYRGYRGYDGYPLISTSMSSIVDAVGADVTGDSGTEVVGMCGDSGYVLSNNGTIIRSISTGYSPAGGYCFMSELSYGDYINEIENDILYKFAFEYSPCSSGVYTSAIFFIDGDTGGVIWDRVDIPTCITSATAVNLHETIQASKLFTVDDDGTLSIYTSFSSNNSLPSTTKSVSKSISNLDTVNYGPNSDQLYVLLSGYSESYMLSASIYTEEGSFEAEAIAVDINDDGYDDVITVDDIIAVYSNAPSIDDASDDPTDDSSPDDDSSSDSPFDVAGMPLAEVVCLSISAVAILGIITNRRRRNC